MSEVTRCPTCDAPAVRVAHPIVGAALFPGAYQYVREREFVPLNPETPYHDMKIGPCKCGAWHDGDVPA